MRPLKKGEKLTPRRAQQREFILNEAHYTGFVANVPEYWEPDKKGSKVKPRIQFDLAKTIGIFSTFVPIRIYGEKMERFKKERIRKGDFVRVHGCLANHPVTVKSGKKIPRVHLNVVELTLLHRSHDNPERRDGRTATESYASRPNPLRSRG